MPDQSRLEVICCRECGARRHVEPAARSGQCVAPSGASGFVIDHVEVTFLGRCPTCVAGRVTAEVPEAG